MMYAKSARRYTSRSTIPPNRIWVYLREKELVDENRHGWSVAATRVRTRSTMYSHDYYGVYDLQSGGVLVFRRMLNAGEKLVVVGDDSKKILVTSSGFFVKSVLLHDGTYWMLEKDILDTSEIVP